MNRINKARLGVAGVVLSGVVATTVASSASASATTVSRAPATVQTLSIPATAPSSFVPLSAAPNAVGPTQLLAPSTQLGGIGPFITAVLKFLGKSATWLKNGIKAGYNWFVTNVWNKIPGWIKAIVGWGLNAWEVFNLVKDYLF